MNKEKIVFTMPMKNAEKTVVRSIESFLKQTSHRFNKKLIIADDHSTDESPNIVKAFLDHPEITLVNVNFGQAYQTRNFLNDYVRRNYPDTVLIGRLDADDILANDFVIQQVEQIYQETDFDVLIGSNRQERDGKLLSWINKADKRLLEDNYLEERLKKMALGLPQSELPSCNLIIKPSVNIEYPARVSAEDHWFLVEILLNKGLYKIVIESELIYSVYSLGGDLSLKNKKSELYLDNRRQLYDYFRDHRG